MLQKYRWLGILFGAFVAAVLVISYSTEPDLATLPTPTSAVTSEPTPPRGDQIRVEVSGAVATPGVYSMPPGSRLIDAITAAGGWGERIDPVRIEICLNLAAPLIDGSAIRIPTRDDQFLLGVQGISCGTLYAAPTEIAAAETTTVAAATATGGKIDLNKATAEQLDTLPGIGPATAAKIIAARAAAPFLIVDELKVRGIISDRVLQQIRPLVTP